MYTRVCTVMLQSANINLRQSEATSKGNRRATRAVFKGRSGLVPYSRTTQSALSSGIQRLGTGIYCARHVAKLNSISLEGAWPIKLLI